MALPFLKIKRSKELNLSTSPKERLDQLIKQAQQPSFSLSLPVLYTKQNLHQCPWPQTEEGEYAKNFILPLMQEGVTSYIQNIKTELVVLIWEDLVLPVTLNEKEYDNSYVCSPYSFYISYAKKSVNRLVQSWAQPLIGSVLNGLSRLFYRYEVNKIVTVNNWLLSTNLYPALDRDQIQVLALFLQKQFPDHAIVFRSLDLCTSDICYHSLNQLGYQLIASREIFLTDTQKTKFFESRLFKSDLKLLNQSQYEILEHDQLSEEEIPRLLELYQNLFIDKHSNLNPQFTLKFLILAYRKKIFYFKALKKEGRIEGVIGVVKRNGILFCPFLGYNLKVSQEVGLYRMLCTLLLLEAQKQKLLFHQSAGASLFKKIRKAVPYIEYTAVYYQKLPLKRKIPWWILKKVCNSLGIFYMKRY